MRPVPGLSLIGVYESKGDSIRNGGELRGQSGPTAGIAGLGAAHVFVDILDGPEEERVFARASNG